MTETCPDCGDEFDTAEGLEIHREVEHPDDDGSDLIPEPAQDIGDRFVDVWKHPKAAFLLGVLLGVIVVGSIMFSPQSAFIDQSPNEIGEKVLSHYRALAPPGIDYRLSDATAHVSGMYKITLTVERGDLANQETVYVTQDGKWVFEATPDRVKADISSIE